ncbi:alginate O-acetyltransferase AlgX-related protein [Saccharomonospora viridis]|jgi:alginate O-acetyltransferase complex protein AlgJ|uniref:AlgX/AlgJ SGNH hydrolase-like domain-containing protein n=1 Tax=Saccharomonospora viridis TaxID=1852 RepID=A0A837DB14_9PSEU|nr:hypothetical protein [Saccharomonospora viridis]KHF44797.1 hypothetical protein MINT15_16790 [Saccharomonospora viridis]SFP20397.1 SGNH hydrolase-like domain-containing protein, acetyltransferase AlgX [Saccharomonospora viridis]
MRADNQLKSDGRPTALPAVHEAWLPREHSLYRPRHGRRQTVALVCAAVFFLSPLVSFALGARPSEFENRALTPFPSLADGWSFFTQLAPWATDHLVLREEAIHAADAVSRGVFGEPPPLGDGPKQGGPLQPAPTESEPRQVHYPSVVEGKNDWLYLGDEVASHCEPTRPLEETVAQLRKLRDGVEATGRRFITVIAPDKATLLPENLPDEYIGKECHQRNVDKFWRLLGTEDYVLDLRAGLLAWGDQLGEPVYGPQDAHWSDEGGVLMARGLAERLRPGISAEWKVTPTSSWRVPADIPPLIGREGETVGRHYALAPNGEQDLTQDVEPDYRTPLTLDTASGPGTYGLGVGLLGDSFTIRALPYLSAAFANMTVLHHDSVSEDHGATAANMLAGKDVVVLEIAERSLARGGPAVLSEPALSTVLDALSR